MSKARKLPSGSWRCQVYSHTEEVCQPDGTIKQKRIYKSFTCDDPSPKGRRMCERAAAEWAAEKEKRKNRELTMTFGDALELYINERSAILSPATIRKYRSMERTSMKALEKYDLTEITQEVIQSEINKLSATLSPKSVRDAHGLLSSVMARFCPDMTFRTALPKKVRPDTYVPTDDDIQRLVDCVIGTDMEIPVYLAAFGSLRRGEISALEADDISGNVVHVHRAMVLSTDGEWVTKNPKSYAGDRFVTMPDFVIQKISGKEGRIVDLRPNMITSRFSHVLNKAGLQHFRFHDLRHYNASIKHALGIPDAYIMRDGGWGSDAVLKQVYRHTMEDAKRKADSIALSHFEGFVRGKDEHDGAS